jgi:hypothetical protein
VVAAVEPLSTVQRYAFLWGLVWCCWHDAFFVCGPRPTAHLHKKKKKKNIQSNPIQLKKNPPQSNQYDPSAEVSPWLSTGREVLDMYTRLRAQAREAAIERNKFFMQSTEAYRAGDSARAGALSKKGREANEQMRGLHARACDAIFEARNRGNAGLASV